MTLVMAPRQVMGQEVWVWQDSIQLAHRRLEREHQHQEQGRRTTADQEDRRRAEPVGSSTGQPVTNWEQREWAERVDTRDAPELFPGNEGLEGVHP